MAKNLPAAIILQKNRLHSDEVWLFLLDIALPDNTTLYFVRNNEDITFNGQLYTALPFDLEPTRETSRGELPTITLRISNITRFVQAYLEDPEINGAIASTVTVRLVHTSDLSGGTDFSELQMDFEVIATESDPYFVHFTLGSPNPMNRRYPFYRYLANHCPWQFNQLPGKEGLSPECGYTGADTSCNRSLADCQGKNNSGRFGGCPGLNKMGIRYAL